MLQPTLILIIIICLELLNMEVPELHVLYQINLVHLCSLVWHAEMGYVLLLQIWLDVLVINQHPNVILWNQAFFVPAESVTSPALEKTALTLPWAPLAIAPQSIFAAIQTPVTY